MKRRAALFLAAVVGLVAANGAALAAGSPASPNASCVGTITSFEASQLAPGAVGAEVSRLATAGAGLGGLVSDLAHTPGGSIEACVEAEE